LVDFEVTSVFSTQIGRLRVPDADAMNQELQALILSEEAKYGSVGRSNVGGWHSHTDFLSRPEAAVAAPTVWITWAVRQMVDATAGPGVFKGTLSVPAWATICRGGAYHAPHSQPDHAWSGVYYVDAGTPAPGHTLSGVLEFLDPRGGVEAVTAPGDPYGAPVRVRPEAGLLVIFPSWLYHWVHPYMGDRPRIAVSFNAMAAARPPIESSSVDTGESERHAGNVLTAPLHQRTMDATVGNSYAGRASDGWLPPRAGGERP
jgi:uncharacterized protein (TIGR02466 family)